jgi:hypothetical protein
MPLLLTFLAFIIERYRILQRRESGHAWPWSDDSIMQKYKFCNVQRESDKVTRWITDNWRKPHASDPDLWFALVIARRCLNWPDTMAQLGYPTPFDSAHYLSVMRAREAAGETLFGSSAYKLIVPNVSGNLAEMHVQHILNPLWANRAKFVPRVGDTLAGYYARLAAVPYMGSFTTAQVIADLKHEAPLAGAPDWWTFAASGPGSRRGLNRVCGRPVNAPWQEHEWYAQLQRLAAATEGPLAEAGVPKLCLQNLQNCNCEFDKLERIKAGEGKVRPYHHAAEPQRGAVTPIQPLTSPVSGKRSHIRMTAEQAAQTAKLNARWAEIKADVAYGQDKWGTPSARCWLDMLALVPFVVLHTDVLNRLYEWRYNVDKSAVVYLETIVRCNGDGFMAKRGLQRPKPVQLEATDEVPAFESHKRQKSAAFTVTDIVVPE